MHLQPTCVVTHKTEEKLHLTPKLPTKLKKLTPNTETEEANPHVRKTDT